MSKCSSSDGCPFHSAVEASVIKRIRFASAYPYCNGSMATYCAIRKVLSAGGQPDTDLLPDGSHGERWDETAASRAVTSGALSYDRHVSSSRRFLVVEDSPIFAKFACNSIQYIYPDAEVIECHTYADAARELRANSFRLVVSGFGLDGGKTAHDIRKLSDAPMVLLTGRPDRDTQGLGTAAMVQKGAGSDAMRAAITGLLGA
ncbi:MAG: hypothetical protein ACYC6C_05075 [Coriobacteriia bacterium]